jgi:putative ABC transport system permease protein
MGLVRIAWRNLWRHRRRTLITAGGMGLAMGLVLGMACLQDGMFSMMADVMIRQKAGHVQIAHPDWPSRQLLYDTVPQSVLSQVSAVPGVEGTSGRLFSYGLAASDTSSLGARYVGLDPTADRAIREFESNLTEGDWLAAQSSGEVVIGEGMARELELSLGQDLVFLGQAADGSTANELLKVVGIFSTGLNQMDRSGAYMHLADMQRLLALDEQLHQVLIVGEGLSSAGPLASALREIFSGEESVGVWTWQEADPTTAQMMAMRDVGLFIMLFIVFSVAGLSVLNTMLMTVFERTRELGVLRALGMSRLAMMSLVVLEALLLALVATGLGLLIGGIFDYLLIEYGFPYETSEGKGLSWQGITFPPAIYGAFSLRPLLITVAFLNGVAVLAAVWPAIRVARLKPVEAMVQR